MFVDQLFHYLYSNLIELSTTEYVHTIDRNVVIAKMMALCSLFIKLLFLFKYCLIVTIIISNRLSCFISFLSTRDVHSNRATRQPALPC